MSYQELAERALAKAEAAYGAPVRRETARELAERLLSLAPAQRRVALHNRAGSTLIITCKVLCDLALEYAHSDPVQPGEREILLRCPCLVQG